MTKPDHPEGVLAEAVPGSVVVDERTGVRAGRRRRGRARHAGLQRLDDDDRRAAELLLIADPCVGRREVRLAGGEPRPHRRIRETIDSMGCAQLRELELTGAEEMDDNRVRPADCRCAGRQLREGEDEEGRSDADRGHRCRGQRDRSITGVSGDDSDSGGVIAEGGLEVLRSDGIQYLMSGHDSPRGAHTLIVELRVSRSLSDLRDRVVTTSGPPYATSSSPSSVPPRTGEPFRAPDRRSAAI
jgi:hypothetical protein